jgi:hypothetical protein
MTGLLGNWGSNIEQGLLSALPVLAENDPYKIGQQLLREGAGVGGIAWHGSPHKYLKPDLSKMGTGEGAQAYGHGFYSAEAQDVGQTYRDALTAGEDAKVTFQGKQIPESSKRGFSQGMDNLGFTDRETKTALIHLQGSKSIDEAVASARTNGDASSDRIADFLEQNREQLTHELGYLYKMNIPDETIDKMLDWDKPLSEQSENVRAALVDLAEDYSGKVARGGDDYLGSTVYSRLSKKYGQSKTSAIMAGRGIPGIKYLDGMSRAAGQGSRNFVSFTPDHIEMLERNGIPMKGLLGE